MKAVLFSIAAGVAVAAPVPQLIGSELPILSPSFGCGGFFQLSGLANTCSTLSTAMGITAAELAIYNPGVILGGCADINARLDLAGVSALCARPLIASVAAAETFSNFNLQVIAPGLPFDQQYLAIQNNLLTLSPLTTGITAAEFSLANRQLLLNPILSGVSDVSSLLFTPTLAQSLFGVSNIASLRQIDAVALTPGAAQISRISDVAGVSNVAGVAAYPGVAGIAAYPGVAGIAAYPGAVYGAGLGGYKNIANVAAVPGSVAAAGVADVAGAKSIAQQAYTPGTADVAGVVDTGAVASNSHIAANPGAIHEGGVTDLRSPVIAARQVADLASNARVSQIQNVAANPGAVQASTITDAAQTSRLATAYPMSIYGNNIFGLAPFTSLAATTLPYGTLVTGFDMIDNVLAFNQLQTLSVCATGSSYQFLFATLVDQSLACAGQIYSVRMQMVESTVASQAIAGVY